jgi:hypothetical protein
MTIGFIWIQFTADRESSVVMPTNTSRSSGVGSAKKDANSRSAPTPCWLFSLVRKAAGRRTKASL